MKKLKDMIIILTVVGCMLVGQVGDLYAASLSTENTAENVAGNNQATDQIPEEPADKPEDSLDNPEEPVDKPEDSLDAPEEPADKPEDSLAIPEEPADKAEEPVDKPEDSLGTSNGTFNNAARSTPTEAKNFIFEDGKIIGYIMDGPKDVVLPETYTVTEGDVSTTFTITEIAEGAFAGMQLTSFEFNPNSKITKIGNSAFQNNTMITSMVIPENVTSIGTSVFLGCTTLASVTLPQNITSIPNKMFENCYALNNFVLGDKITSIGSHAFSNCRALTSINIPNTVRSIGEQAFYYCTTLTSADLPDSVISLGNYTFANCSRLTKIRLSENLTSLPGSLFMHSSLTEITIPNRITAIYSYAFYNNDLTSVTLGTGLKTIYSDVFASCDQLKEITIPDNVTSIGSDAFEYISDIAIHLETREIDSITGSPWGAINAKIYWKDKDNSCFNVGKNGILLGYKPSDHSNCTNSANHTATELTIPDKIGEQTITSIALGAFRGNKALRKVVIPNTVTSIGGYAFFGCSSLREVLIGEAVTSIGTYAFSSTILSNVTIPDSVTTISSYAFSSNSYLKKITFGTGIQTISTSAFSSTYDLEVYLESKKTGTVLYAPWEGQRTKVYWKDMNDDDSCFYVSDSNVLLGLKPGTHTNCRTPELHGTSLFTLKIPSQIRGITVKEIQRSAFKANTAIRDVILPDTITKIDNYAFQSCTNLKTIKMSNNLTTIGYSVFASCRNLLEVSLPDTLTSLGSNTFEYCTVLTKVDLGNRLPTIQSYTFRSTPALKEIIIPDSVTYIDSWAFYNSGLTNIVIPDSVKTISSSAFSSSPSLQYVSLGRNVATIGSSAFAGTKITEINFPETLTKVELNSLPSTVKTIYVDAVRMNFAPRFNQPWGAAGDAAIKYRGEFIEGFTTVKYNEDFSKATISLNLKAEPGGYIQSIEQPNGNKEDNIGKNEYTTSFEINKPGLYTYKITSSNATRDFEVYVDQLNPIAIEGFDFLIKDTALATATDADIVSMAGGKAYMKDAPDTPLTINFTPNLATIKSTLDTEGEKISVKLSAEGTIQGDSVTYRSEKNIAITYTTKNHFTVTFKDHDGSIIDKQTVVEKDDAVTPMHPKRTGYTFIGWDKAFTNITGDLVVNAQYRLLPKWTGRTTIDIPINQTFDAKTHIKAEDGDGNTPTTVTSSGTVNVAKTGSYTVTYTMTDKWGGTAKQAVIFKVKEKVSVNTTAKESISGKNIIMTLDEIKKGFADGNLGTVLMANADINAVNTDDGKPLTNLTVDTSKILQNKGSYPFVVKTANTTLTLNVQIYNQRESQRGMNGLDAYFEIIYANDFTISEAESANITESRIIALANASAYDEVIAKSINVSVKDITAIQNKPRGKATYPLTFTTSNGTEVTVNVSVVDNSGLNTANSEYICANDIFLSKDQVTAGLSHADIKLLSKVTAVKLTGEDVAVTVTGTILPQTGAYDVTFTTALNTTMIIKARVHDHKVNNGTETIYVNDTYISESEAASGAEADFVRLANAKAFDSTTENSVAISMTDINAIKNKKRGIYTVGWKTDKATTTTSSITVRGSVATTGTTRISGNNFSISASDVDKASALDALLMKVGNVNALTLEGKVQGVRVKDKSALKNVPGIYNVIFASDNADKAELTLQVEVTEHGTLDDTKKEILTANNVQIPKAQVSSLSADSGKLLIQLAHAKAVNLANGSDVAITSATTDAQASKGEYSATFKTTAGTALKIKVTVQDNGSSDVAKKEYISANNFKITIDEYEDAVKTSTLGNVLLQKANVRANDIESGKIIPATVQSHTLTNKKGKYSVTFATIKGTATTVEAIVVDEAVIDPAKNEAIYANDFAISLDDSANITHAKLIQWANAYAEDTVTGANIAVSVKSHTVANKLGVYEVTFETAKGTETTVQATVKPSGTTNPTTKESIYASDFQLEMNEVDTLNNALLIKRAGAQARDENGYEVEITSVEQSIQKLQGKYDVTFKTQKGTSVTVKASVSSKVVVDDTNNEIIKANDFKIRIGDVTAATEAKLIQLASAKAYKLDSGADVKVSLKTKGLQASIGTYDVVFQTASGTSITVKGTVTDSSGSNPQLDEEIYANDFTVSVEEVQNGFTDAQLKEKARVDAVEVSTGKKLTINVNSTKLVAKVGVYDVTFSTANGTSITIHVTVTEKGSADNTDTAKKDLIYASDFSLSIAEALSADVNALISMAKAKAYDKATGAPVSITIKNNESLTGKGQGAYPLTFVSKNGSEIAVTATITTSNGTNPDSSVNERITANDFSIKAADVTASPTDEVIIALAKAKAVNTETGADLKITVASGLKNQKGVYDVTFSTTKKTTITVKGTVIENASTDNEEPSKQDLIYANDFSLSVEEAAAITEDQLISMANAKAYDKASGAPVKVSVQDIAVVQGKTQGIYQVTYTSANGSSITVDATITKSNGSNPDTSVKERISANDFSVKAAEVTAGLTGDAIIALAKAKAVNTETGADLEILVTSGLKNQRGVYSVTFSTDKGTTITVKGTVTENSSENSGHVLYANGFSISEADAKTVDADKLIKMANAKAYDKASGAPVTVSVAVNQIKDKTQGKYNVIYKTDKTSVTVEVIVTGNGNSGPVGNVTEHITANDFSISLKEMESATLDNDLISLAKAKAFVEETGEELKITVTDKPQKKKGVYDVTFKTPNNISVTVKGTVVENSSPEADDHVLHANGFSINEADAEKVNEATLIKMANAKAYDKASGAPVKVSVVADQIQGKTQGKYDVKYTTDQTSVTVQVIVTGSGNSGAVGNVTERITANDFSISLKEMASATLENDLISLAKAKAFVEETGEELNVLVESQLEAKKGVYNVTFKTSNNTLVTVQGTVVENSSPADTEHLLYANDFSISEAKAETINEAGILLLANAKGYEKESGAPVVVHVEDVYAIKGQPKGKYTVTLKTDKTSINVSVIITSGGTSNPTDNEEITANDFSIEAADVTDLLTNDAIIALAKASAVNTTTGAALTIEVQSKLQAEKGVYDVTFLTVKGTSITVKGTVIENASTDNVDPNKTDLIYANDFSLSVAEATAITEDQLISMANAKAYDKASGAPVKVTVQDVTVVQGKPQGIYQVTFASANGSTIAVKATITKSSVINPDSSVKERITANDFSIKAADVTGLDNDAIIALAKAKAVNTETGADLDITVTSGLQNKRGVYDVTFSTDKGTTITVKGTVVENASTDNEDPGKQDLIYANDFSLSVAEAAAITEDQLISMANAKAYDKASGAPITVNVAVDQIENKPQGIYKVTYTSANGSSITVNATITKSNVVNPDPSVKERISANDFSVKAAEVTGLDNDAIIALAKAKAVNTETGADLAITVNSGLQNKKGVYDVTFSTEKGTTITVEGTVTENSSPEADDHVLHANGFSISETDAETVDEATLIKMANAKAYDKASGAPVKVSVAVDQIQGKTQGKYNVEYTTEKTSVTVEVIVTGNGSSGTVDGKTERIMANDFSISLEEMKRQDLAEYLIQLAKAKAFIEETGEELEVLVDSSLEAKRGMYDVIFKTVAGTSVTVKGTVVENSSPETDEHILHANGFSISETDAETVNEATLIALANAKAYDKASGAPVVIRVDVKQIKGKTQGKYDVTYTTDKTSVTVEVMVTSGGSFNPDTNEKISANDFSVRVVDVKGLTDEKIIALANAIAINNESGSVVELKVISELQSKKGVYNVTFSTTKGTTITVKGTVVEKGSENEGHVLHANGFSISEADAKTVDADKLIKMANAKAYDKVSGAPVAISVDVNQIKGKTQGKYDVTYTTGKTSVTVEVIVTGNGNSGVVDGKTERIMANDFSISVEEMKRQDLSQYLIQLAKAKAFVEETGEELKVLVDSSLEAKRGMYDVIFKTSNHTSVTVKGTVVESSSPEMEEHLLYANGFSISEAEAKTVDEATLIRLANAKAYDKVSGAPVTVRVDASQIKDRTQGKYELAFKTSKAEVVVFVHVTGMGEIAKDPETNETIRLSANDFYASVDNVEHLSDEEIIRLANARAFVEETGAEKEIIVTASPMVARGVYMVSFTLKNQNIGMDVKMNVMDREYFAKEQHEKVYANDIWISKAMAREIDESSLLRLSRARAMLLETGAILGVEVKENIVKGKPTGVYEIVYVSEHGNELTGEIHVMEEGILNEELQELISANNFVIDAKEVELLDTERILDSSKAKAIDLETGADIGLKTTGEVEAKGGKYSIYLSTEKGTKMKIQVTVEADSKEGGSVDSKSPGSGQTTYNKVEKADRPLVESSKNSAKKESIKDFKKKESPKEETRERVTRKKAVLFIWVAILLGVGALLYGIKRRKKSSEK